MFTITNSNEQNTNPPLLISDNPVARRFAENPARVCRYCKKASPTGLDHYECELRSFGEETR